MTSLRTSILGVLLAVSPLVSATGMEEPAGGLAALVDLPKPVDGISPAQLAKIQSSIAAYEKKKAATGRAVKAGGPFLIPFFPQAGILGRDLFLTNFTDQDPRTGPVLDWDCSDYTYDGHRGHDSVIRSFREQAIGVPVFAALDGVVVETHDGEPDMNTVWEPQNEANLVVIDHGDGYLGWYLHFKRGSVAVVPGQTVRAGTQLGLTGSSGFSNWPHLHFQVSKDGKWFEPSAGTCRSGESFWASQPPVDRDFYVADFSMTRGLVPLPDRDVFLLDSAVRTATFLKGRQVVSQRVELRNLQPRLPYTMRIVNPRGTVALEESAVLSNDELFLLPWLDFWFDLDLDVPGTWRFQLDIDGGLAVNAPFRVVTSARQVTNRAPAKVKTRLTPASPVEGEVLTCEVQTSLITEDPDYDVVSYRYDWKVNGRLVRSVTSAALTDLLAAGTAQAKDRVTCTVAAADGRGRGPASAAVRTIEAE